MRSACRIRSAGFTFIEMIMVITITAVLGSVVMVFVAKPMESYKVTSFRRTLVDAGESALRRVALELRGAVPNSVRITNTASGFALEMLPGVDGAKYNVIGPAAFQLLAFAGDTDFNLLGCFRNPAILLGVLNPLRIVINELGTTGNDVYADAGLAAGSQSVITPAFGMTITLSVDPGPGVCGSGGNSHHIKLAPSHSFKGGASTNQRLFLVTTPVTYLCDSAAGTLKRYSAYTIQATQPTTAATLNALPGVQSSQVTGNVSGCSLSTTSGDVRNFPVVTATLSLLYQGDTMTLVQQTALNNSR